MDKNEYNYQSTELPRLSLSRSRHINDFEVERVDLLASGWTTEDVRAGMDYLLLQLEKRFGGGSRGS